ncbi:MAG: hypothetical protein ACK50Z_16400 [Betaproteobacteria bacterium]
MQEEIDEQLAVELDRYRNHGLLQLNELPMREVLWAWVELQKVVTRNAAGDASGFYVRRNISG